MKYNFAEEPQSFQKYMLGFSCYYDDPLSFYFRLSRYKFFLRHIQHTDHVLELACAEGLGTYMLATKAQHITAVEVEQELIDFARTYFMHDTIEYICENALDINLDKKFDVIIASEVHEYLTREEAGGLHAIVTQHLKQSGLFFLSVPNKFSQVFATERRKTTHTEEYSADELEALLKKTFLRVMLYHKTDEFILPAFPDNGYNLIACCSGIK